MITANDIESAYTRIQSYLRYTPVIEIEGDALGVTHPVSFKLEQLQHTGSFKPRGAFNALLAKDIPSAGVVAASGGNHGAAIAFAAGTLDIPAKIFLPDFTVPVKIERIRSFGAAVEVTGSEFTQTLSAAQDYAAGTGAVSVHPYDELETVAGQGSLGLEIEKQLPELDTLLVSVGGGGLIGGIAAWFEDRVKIVSVESEGTATLFTALKSGPDAEITASGIAASALGASRVGTIVYPTLKRSVKQAVLVSDRDIIEAQRRLWSAARIIAEPGGVTALAALTSGTYKAAIGENIGVVICGANADPSWFMNQ